MKAQWAFFATLHGKSPCDGIEGKRTTTRANLQRPLVIQIIEPLQMLEFCVSHINKILQN